MKPAQPRDIRSKDKSVDESLREHRDFITDALARPHLWGNFIPVTFSSPDSPTKINHGIDGGVTGYLIVKTDVYANVSDAVAPNNEPGLWLQASAACSVTLLVF